MRGFARQQGARTRGSEGSIEAGATDPIPWPALMADIPGIIGIFDASTQSTLHYGQDMVLTQIDNIVSGGNPLVPGQHGAPKYNPVSAVGMPAVEWPDTSNHLGMALGFDAPCSELFIFCQYADGVRDTFDGYVSFVTPQSSGSPSRIMGNSGGGTMWNGKKASVNGGAFSATVLPLPLSCVRLSSSELSSPLLVNSVGAYTSGHNGSGIRSWSGAILGVVAISDQASPTQQHISAIEQAGMQYYGVTP